MNEYEFWKYLHILMFVFWLGTDMGVFLCARKSTDSSLSFETRAMLLHMALRIELLPRTMWKAALPLGVALSAEMGLIEIGWAGLALTWLFTFAWWSVSMTGAWFYDRPVGHRLGTLNGWITSGVGFALIAAAALSAQGLGPVEAGATWLHWKIGLYGLVNLMVVAMLRVFDPIGAAFGQLATEGSTPEIETLITSTMTRATVVIWITYITIAIVAFIATTRIV
jgi:hypothetical protein